MKDSTGDVAETLHKKRWALKKMGTNKELALQLFPLITALLAPPKLIPFFAFQIQMQIKCREKKQH